MGLKKQRYAKMATAIDRLLHHMLTLVWFCQKNKKKFLKVNHSDKYWVYEPYNRLTFLAEYLIGIKAYLKKLYDHDYLPMLAPHLDANTSVTHPCNIKPVLKVISEMAMRLTDVQWLHYRLNKIVRDYSQDITVPEDAQPMAFSLQAPRPEPYLDKLNEIFGHYKALSSDTYDVFQQKIVVHPVYELSSAKKTDHLGNDAYRTTFG